MRNKTKTYVKNYKDCLLNNKIILQSQQRFKNDHHNVYKAQRTNAFKVCESEMLSKI